MGGACGGFGEMKNADGVLVRIPEENTLLGKPRLTRQNNINNCPTRCDFVQSLFSANFSICFG
jgi:hypothetical protein